jgi:uncharacterized protein (TIGR02001 family)
MIHRNKEVQTLKSCMLGLALMLGLAMPAQANDLTLGGTATLTTDYMFRGVSQTNQNPAVQASLDASYGIFYAGMWGSNVDFGGNGFGREIATLEIDYYAGIAPTWRGITFDLGGYFFTYPGAYDPGGDLNYFELKTGASYTFTDSLTLTVANWWSPDYSGEIGDGDALELSAEYGFDSKIFNFFTPSVSALVGWQWTTIEDFTFWNAGLTLGFMDNWSADIRYWDTDLNETGCTNVIGSANNCGARVVGTVTASF